MNASKRARHSSSVSNRTDVYGTMPGIVSSVGRKDFIRTAYKRAPTQFVPSPSVYNFFPTPNGGKWDANKTKNAYYYLVSNGMLSKNPVANSFKRTPHPSAAKRGGKDYNMPWLKPK